jgi:spore maturation protein A
MTGSDSAGFMQGLLGSCEEAVYFVIGLAGIMGLWSGFMNVARGSGLIQAMAERCSGLMHFLFPNEKDEETLMMMLMGFTANIFGAGNSATVFSLQAMKRLDEENGHSETASNEMCMFASVNMSMMQLVPITVIQIRANAGSADPSDIIVPSVIAGAAATAVSVAVCKMYEMRERRLVWRKHHG